MRLPLQHDGTAEASKLPRPLPNILQDASGAGVPACVLERNERLVTVLHAISTAVVVLIVLGVVNRRTPMLHQRLMTTAFLLDLALVLYIETTRHAVERVVGPAGPLVWFHAAVSTAVLGLYVAQLRLGRQLLAGRTASRRVHVALGLTFLLCRGLNYATAFLVSAPVPAVTAAYAAAPTSIPAALVAPVTSEE